MNERQAAEVPIRDSLGAALRFARENWRFVVTVSAIGAAVSVLILAIGLASPAFSLFGAAINRGVEAFVYAAFTAAALAGVAAARTGLLANGWRVWAAMLIIAFFLFIVFFVVSIPVAIALFAGPLAQYLPDLQAAGSDQQAVAQVMARFAQENPGALLVVMVFLGAIWMVLTSRLYLAAPATVDQGRILTFETWAWTKGATLRIIGARLWLLTPAFFLSFALSYIVGLLVGVDPGNPAAAATLAASNQVLLLVYSAFSAFFTFAIYSALEAGLSTALYQRMKNAQPPAA